MKFVTWNCAMALKKKLDAFLSLSSDVAILQEASEAAIAELGEQRGYTVAWFGDNKNKGMGVIAKHPWRIVSAEKLEAKWATLIKIEGPLPFHLVAIWACAVKVGSSYVGQVHLALDVLEQRSLKGSLIIAGDFNSNVIWDSKRKRNHTLAVERMKHLGCFSAYHKFSCEEQGSENGKTLFMHRSALASKHYHIDYAFLSADLLAKLQNVTIGTYADWSGKGGHSDHAPLVVTIA